MRKVHEFTIALADIDSAAEKLSEAFLFRSLEHFAHHPHEYFDPMESSIVRDDHHEGRHVLFRELHFGKTKVNDRVYFPDHLTMVTEVDGCDDYPASRMTIFIESACVRFLYEQDCDSELDEDIYLGLRRKAYEQKDRELLERIVENSKKSESLD